MKRLLITEANTSLGQSICAQFDKAAEWDIVATKRSQPSVDLISRESGTAEIPGVKEFIAGYQNDPVEFKQKVLDADVIICPLTDNTEEAAAAIRMLANTSFEWEKTFVLVSSTMTWADTYKAQKAEAEAERLAERQAMIEAGEELPEEEENAEPEEEEEAPTFTEDQYQRRVSHPRFDQWKELERFTKQANSETLHTYVLFAGLQYGHGEDTLHHLMRSAWHGEPLPMYTGGSNVVPMIHVDDLANAVFKVGTALDVLSQRYILAVDKGNCTLGGVIKAINSQIGTGETVAISEARQHSVRHIEQLTVDLKTEAATINELIEEEEWICPDGFVTHIEKICNEYMKFRKLQPVRGVVLGGPYSGKTHLAQKLSQSYRVNHLKLAGMIQEYEAYVTDLKSKLTIHRAEKKESRRLAAKEEKKRAEREAAEEAETAREEELANAAGAADDDDDEDGEGVNHKNDDSDIKKDDEDNDDFIDFEIETPPPKASSPSPDEEGEEGEAAAAEAAENETEGEENLEEEADDEDDEVLNQLKEAIAHADKVLSCRVKPVQPEAPVDEDGEPIEKPVDSPKRPMKGKPYGEVAETSSSPAQEVETPEEPLRLRDAALATIVRWRLGSRDCRCQGYVLDGFPKTVRQAALTFMVGEGGIPIPEPDEADELPEGEELKEMMMAAVDDKVLPENIFYLQAKESFLLTRCEKTKNVDDLARFYRRLKEFKQNFILNDQPQKNVVNWFRSILTHVEGSNPREATVLDVDVAKGTDADAVAKFSETIGPQRFYRPTPLEIVEEAKLKRLEEERMALAHIQAEEEARRVEAELQAAKKKEKERHERRYRSIQEEQAEVSATIADMPMQTYLMENIVPALTKGIAHCVQLRPDDPVNTLGDYLFEYEPNRKL